MANNTYSTPVINNFDAIKGDTNSPDTLSTEIKHGIQSRVSGFSWLVSFLLSV